jgi:hypothetical protein
MMIQGRALITGTIAVLISCAAAHAADPPRSWPVYERPAPRYVEMVSGWYVRGDFGYRFNEMQSVQGGQPVTSFNYPDSLGVTAGGGYKYQWFRFDATVDYAPASQHAQPPPVQRRSRNTRPRSTRFRCWRISISIWVPGTALRPMSVLVLA